MNVPRWLTLSALASLAACTGDTTTATDSSTPPPDSGTSECACGSITSASASSLPVNALSQGITVALDGESGMNVTCTLTEAPGVWHQFVTAHAVWQYLDDGSPAADGWTDLGFDGGSWSTGRAPLGYGDEANTELDPTASTDGDVLTAWFRVEFEVDDPARYAELTLSWLKDDGVALYLNGTAVVRDNLPDEALTPETGAVDKLSGSEEDEWNHSELSGGLLAGTNVLAAEVHQADKYSNDLSFDARFVGWQAAPDTPPSEVHTLSSATCATSHTLELHGLLPDATYRCEARATCGGGAEAFTLTTGSLPADLPDVAIQPLLGSAGLDGVYTLFTHSRDCTEDYTNRLVVVDPEGQIRWYWEHPTLKSSSSADIEAELLPDQTILVAGGEDKDGDPLIIDLAGDPVYEAGYDGLDDHIYHHDIEWEDGSYLGLVEVEGDPDIEYFGFVRVDIATDTVTWEWDNRQDHQDGTMPKSQSNDNDPYHSNSLASMTDSLGPGVATSLLHANVVLKINEATGETDWVLGKRGDFTLLNPDGSAAGDEGWFSGMHGIDVYDDRLWVYDNGWDTDNSRALLYTLDTTAWTAELTFEFAEAGWEEPVWGDADELSTGDVLIDMGHAWCKGGNESHFGALAEIAVPSGEDIWRLDFLDRDDASYRAQRVGGCDLFPGNGRYCP